MYDIFFFEAFEEERNALRQAFSDQPETIGFTYKTIQEYGASEPPAPVISIRTQSEIPVIWASSLKGILTRSTGYDHILAWLDRVDDNVSVPCGYLPKYCVRAVAEHAMLLWTALLRKLPCQQQQFQIFDRDGLTGLESCGKTLLVVGVGNIGSQIVALGEALGMEVKGVDIDPGSADISYVAFAEGIREADVIVSAMNLTKENRNYFNHKTLGQAKEGAVFVNIARGELADTGDLLRLLDEGTLGGVGLDVFEDEPELIKALRGGAEASRAPTDSISRTLALAGRRNVIVTPHNAFNSAEAVQRKAEQSAEQIQAFREHGDFLWPVPAQ